MLLFDVSAVLCMLLDEMICQSFHDFCGGACLSLLEGVVAG
jgi:hypothetical protein